jgi:phosphoribosylglycinamide formyltransferase-1
MQDVVVLASGRGSNFAALVAAQQRNHLPIRLCALLSDKANARALDIASVAGIDAVALSPRAFADRAAFDTALFARVAQYAPALIVLTGYMRVIDAAVIAPWRGKVINIHPSLLPKYPGLHTHQRALDAGDAVHGASVHFVTAELDGGPVIAQVQLPVLPGDSAESLAARLLPLEHRLLVATVDMLTQGRVELGEDGVSVDGRAVERPMRLHDGRTLVADDDHAAHSSAGRDPALAAD